MILSVLLISYSRKLTDKGKHMNLISSAYRYILDLVMKLSEAHLYPFYARLREPEEQDFASSIERRFAFRNMSTALSMHLKRRLSADHSCEESIPSIHASHSMTTSPRYHWIYCCRKFAQTLSYWQSSSQDFYMKHSTLAPIFEFWLIYCP